LFVSGHPEYCICHFAAQADRNVFSEKQLSVIQIGPAKAQASASSAKEGYLE